MFDFIDCLWSGQFSINSPSNQTKQSEWESKSISLINHQFKEFTHYMATTDFVHGPMQ